MTSSSTSRVRVPRSPVTARSSSSRKPRSCVERVGADQQQHVGLPGHQGRVLHVRQGVQLRPQRFELQPGAGPADSSTNGGDAAADLGRVDHRCEAVQDPVGLEPVEPGVDGAAGQVQLLGERGDRPPAVVAQRGEQAAGRAHRGCWTCQAPIRVVT
jgi:hypothetical protein